MDNKRRYYVYTYKRKDNGEVFYIGKGTANRDKDIKHHNQYCVNICNKYGVDIERIYENLTEEEALRLEKETIRFYIDELGYSIALDGKRDRDNKKFLCNHTLGGEGATGYCGISQELREKKRQNFLGENNIAKRPEVRAKLSKHATEHNSFCLPEVREKLSKNHRMKNEEQVKIQSEKLKEFYKTEKGMLLREQARARRLGKIPAIAKSVECIETNQTYSSIAQCAKQFGMERRKLSYLLQKYEIAEIIFVGKEFHITKIPLG